MDSLKFVGDYAIIYDQQQVIVYDLRTGQKIVSTQYHHKYLHIQLFPNSNKLLHRTYEYCYLLDSIYDIVKELRPISIQYSCNRRLINYDNCYFLIKIRLKFMFGVSDIHSLTYS